MNERGCKKLRHRVRGLHGLPEGGWARPQDRLGIVSKTRQYVPGNPCNLWQESGFRPQRKTGNLAARKQTKSPVQVWMVLFSYGCCTNSASMLIVMSLLTSQPPASRATFQVSPQSSRLILVEASKPTEVVPHGDLDVPR